MEPAGPEVVGAASACHGLPGQKPNGRRAPPRRTAGGHRDRDPVGSCLQADQRGHDRTCSILQFFSPPSPRGFGFGYWICFDLICAVRPLSLHSTLQLIRAAILPHVCVRLIAFVRLEMIMRFAIQRVPKSRMCLGDG